MRSQALWIGAGVAVWCNALLYVALLLPPVGISFDPPVNAVAADSVDLFSFLQGNPSSYDSGHFLPAIIAIVCTPLAVLLALLPVRDLGQQVVAVGGGVFLAAGASHLVETLHPLALDLLAARAPGSPGPESGVGLALWPAWHSGQVEFALVIMILTFMGGIVSARLVFPGPREQAPAVEWPSARAAATWATLPLVVLCFVGGFAARSRGLDRWETDWATSGLTTQLAELLFEYRIGPLAGSTGIRNRGPGAELMYLLPALLTALAFLVLVWLVVAWFVRALDVGDLIGAGTGVVSVWAVVTLVSTVVAAVAAAIVEPHDLRFGLDVTIDGARFGLLWGWLAGLAAVVALRTTGRPSTSSAPGTESEVAA